MMNTERSTERYVVGRRAVSEMLASGRSVEKVILSYGVDDAATTAIRLECRRLGVICSVMDRRKFQALEKELGLEQNVAQGVIALRPASPPVSVSELLTGGSDSLVIALDGITDPHNLGAIARSAEGAGASGLILPEKYSAPVTPVAVKASAGALEHLAVAKIPRVSETLKLAKEKGYRIIGAAAPGTVTYDKADYTGPMIIVIGNEGEGLHQSVKNVCDELVEIPMMGTVSSLNASVAAGIIFFAASLQRNR